MKADGKMTRNERKRLYILLNDLKFELWWDSFEGKRVPAKKRNRVYDAVEVIRQHLKGE